MSAKILVYDIETSYLKTKTWTIYDTNVIGQGKGVIEDFKILCFSYKWLGETKEHAIAQRDFEDYVPGVNNDRNVCAVLWHLFDEADIVIAHNGNSFDQKKVRARFVINGFCSPSPFKQIDTKLVARKHFGFTSNKLDDLAKFFGIEGKLDVGGIETWDGCLAGDDKAWDKMVKYNKRDVSVLEKVYLVMRGWMDNHPNLANIIEKPDACPTCGEEVFMYALRFKVTPTGKSKRFQCSNCGAICSIAKRENLPKPTYRPGH